MDEAVSKTETSARSRVDPEFQSALYSRLFRKRMTWVRQLVLVQCFPKAVLPFRQWPGAASRIR